MHGTFIRSRQGMSLIELMIALGISLVILYSTMYMMTNMSKQSAQIKNKLEFVGITKDLEMYLSDPRTCPRLFLNKVIQLPVAYTVGVRFADANAIRLSPLSYAPLGAPPPPAPPTPPVEVAVVGANRSGVTLNRLEFNMVVDDGLPNVGADRVLILNLMVRGTNTDRSMGAPFQDKDYKVRLQINPANRVVQCSLVASATDLNAICIGFGGTMVAGRCVMTPVYQ